MYTALHRYLYNLFSTENDYSMYTKDISLAGIRECFIPPDFITTTGNNLTGVAVQFAPQDQQNATQVQKCIAVFTIKYPITIYI